jgi:hypothetical protein
MLAPWRTGMPDRPEIDLTRPFSDGRPLKRWRWVGLFGEDLMLCVASARIGPIPVSWWAVWDRRTRTLRERTFRRPMAPLEVETGAPVETISPHGGNPIWTRKTPAAFSGTIRLGGQDFTLRDARGLVDESAGYHARETRWHWTTGVGSTADGRAVTWNLCEGLHDAPEASERTVWLDGEPHHVGPEAGAGLRFDREVARVHKENLLLLATDYEQPFGTFGGSLPVAGEITGYGVTERQYVRW